MLCTPGSRGARPNRKRTEGRREEENGRALIAGGARAFLCVVVVRGASEWCSIQRLCGALCIDPSKLPLSHLSLSPLPSFCFPFLPFLLCRCLYTLELMTRAYLCRFKVHTYAHRAGKAHVHCTVLEARQKAVLLCWRLCGDALRAVAWS